MSRLDKKAAETPADSFSAGEVGTTPLDNIDSNDRIREIAYFLWLDAGCPEGEDERHWAAAQELHQSEPDQ